MGKYINKIPCIIRYSILKEDEQYIKDLIFYINNNPKLFKYQIEKLLLDKNNPRSALVCTEFHKLIKIENGLSYLGFDITETFKTRLNRLLLSFGDKKGNISYNSNIIDFLDKNYLDQFNIYFGIKPLPSKGRYEGDVTFIFGVFDTEAYKDPVKSSEIKSKFYKNQNIDLNAHSPYCLAYKINENDINKFDSLNHSITKIYKSIYIKENYDIDFLFSENYSKDSSPIYKFNDFLLEDF